MIASKVLKGVFWLLFGTVGSNLLGLISTLIVARLLVPDDFGVFALAMSVVLIVSALFEMRTSFILIQLEGPDKKDYDTVFTLNLLRGLVISLVLLALSWPIGKSFGDDRVIYLLAVMAVYPLILCLQNPYFENHAREISFAPSSILAIGTKLGSVIGTVGVALIYPTYWSLAVGMFASALVSVGITFVFSDKTPRLSLKSFRRVFSFSIWLTFASIANQASLQSNRLIIGAAFSTSLLGAFALASQVVTQLMTAISSPVNSTVFAAFSRMEQDKEGIRNSFTLCQQAMCAILMPAAAGLCIVADLLVTVLFPAKWSAAILFVQFSALRFLFHAYVGPYWALVMSQGQTQMLFQRTLWSLIVQLVFGLLGLISYGLIGLLIGNVIASAVSMVISFVLVKQVIGLRLRTLLTSPLRPSLVTGAMAIFVLLVRVWTPATVTPALELFISICAGGGAYLVLTILSWYLMGQKNGPETLVLDFIAARLPNLFGGRFFQDRNQASTHPGD